MTVAWHVLLAIVANPGIRSKDIPRHVTFRLKDTTRGATVYDLRLGGMVEPPPSSGKGRNYAGQLFATALGREVAASGDPSRLAAALAESRRAA